MKYLWVPLKGPPITLAINFYCLGNRPLALLDTIEELRVHLAQSFELNNLAVEKFKINSPKLKCFQYKIFVGSNSSKWVFYFVKVQALGSDWLGCFLFCF